jgi:hypothetical protein
MYDLAPMDGGFGMGMAACGALATSSWDNIIDIYNRYLYMFFPWWSEGEAGCIVRMWPPDCNA